MSLILFTSAFPYGKGEQFLETEIKYLAKTFENIIIVPATYGSIKTARDLPLNVDVKQPVLISPIRRVLNLRFLKMLTNSKYLKIIIEELIFSIQKKEVCFFLKALNIAYYTMEEPSIKQLLKNTTNNDILYFYWGHGTAFMLPFLDNVLAKKVFRLHRGDLYEYLYNDYFPFRKHQLKSCDNVFPISVDGVEYLTKKYKCYQNKIKLFRLGTLDHHFITPFKNDDSFHIVSCSSLIEVKRVDLIIQILQYIQDLKIKWTHFGDGILKNKLESLSKMLPPNIEVDFKGFVPNRKVLEFYERNHIDLFINVSFSEGTPVSIMEAMSYGIPIIATDVGGTSEAVTSESGILIEKDFDVKNVAIMIENLIDKKIVFENKRIKAFWSTHFNANKNYNSFCNYLVRLSNTNVEKRHEK